MNGATTAATYVPARWKNRLSFLATQWRAGLGLFGLRGWVVAAIAAVLALVLVGIPTGMIDNPFFARQTAVRIQDYVIWTTTALLMGLVGGSFAVRRAKGGEGRGASGGLLSYFATGCPICNKLVVSVLGVSGALTYFAPVQLYLGIASIALLLWSLHLRLSAMTRSCCVVPAPVEARAKG
ncbi:MAG: hypothetical protein HYY01_05015 [Chloroflexi bacterium]|nr:hypothetical protein [Chloroflexota bacterium]